MIICLFACSPMARADIVLEKAVQTDLSKVKELMTHVWLDRDFKLYSWQIGENVASQLLINLGQLIEDKGTVIILAKDEDNIIGVLMGRKDKNNTLHDLNLYIYDQYRKYHSNKIGQQLVLAVIALNPGIQLVRVTVKNDNYKAIVMYVKLGFTIVTDLNQASGETAADYVLEKRLKAAL